MIRAVCWLICLAFSNLVSATSNLDVFNVRVDGVDYFGYIEPDRNVGGNTATSVIYMMPDIHFTGVAARNNLGRKITLDELDTTTGKVGAHVDFELRSKVPSPIIKQKLLLELHPEDKREVIVFTNPFNQQLSPEQREAQQRQASDLEARSIGDQIGANIRRLEQYRFMSVMPRDLKLELFIEDVLYASKQYGNNVVSTGSTFSLSVPRTEDYFVPAMMLQKEFSLRATFKMKLSKFQMSKAFFFDKNYANYFVDAFKEEVTRASSTSSGILFWKSKSSSLNRYAKDMLYSSQNSGGTSLSESVLIDVQDESMINRVDAFLFPELSKKDVIFNHIKSAQLAIQNGNEDLAEVHKAYAELLKGQVASSKVADAEVDAMAALAALSQENIVAFLANGFAMNASRTSGRLTYRKINNLNASHEDVKRLNQLVINTVWVTHVIEKRANSRDDTPKPTNVSQTRDGAGFTSDSPTDNIILNGFDFSNPQHQNASVTSMAYKCWLAPLTIDVNLLANKKVVYSQSGKWAGNWSQSFERDNCLYHLTVSGYTYCVHGDLSIDNSQGHGRCMDCSKQKCF